MISLTARAAVSLALLLFLAPVARPQGSEQIHPNALALRPPDTLLALDPLRGIFEVRPEGPPMRIVVGDLVPYRAIDFTSALLNGKECVVVSLVLRASDAALAKIAQYSLDGRLVAQWVMPKGRVLSAGVAVDPKQHVAYIANARRPEIYTLELQESPARLRQFAGLRDAGVLGPLILDERRHRLLVGDVVNGAVYSIDLATRRVALLTALGGEPAALAIDGTGERLYVADAAGERIQMVLLQTGAVSTFAMPSELREPRGLAVAPDGGVWVGDAETGTLLLLSDTGALLRTVRAMAPFQQRTLKK